MNQVSCFLGRALQIVNVMDQVSCFKGRALWWFSYPAFGAELWALKLVMDQVSCFKGRALWWISYPAFGTELWALKLDTPFQTAVEWVSLVMDQTGCKSRKMVIYYTLGPLVAIKVQSWPWTWMALEVIDVEIWIRELMGPEYWWCGIRELVGSDNWLLEVREENGLHGIRD